MPSEPMTIEQRAKDTLYILSANSLVSLGTHDWYDGRGQRVIEILESTIRAAVAQEREACAAACERVANRFAGTHGLRGAVAVECVNEIRAPTRTP